MSPDAPKVANRDRLADPKGPPGRVAGEADKPLTVVAVAAPVAMRGVAVDEEPDLPLQHGGHTAPSGHASAQASSCSRMSLAFQCSPGRSMPFGAATPGTP